MRDFIWVPTDVLLKVKIHWIDKPIEYQNDIDENPCFYQTNEILR